MKQMEFLFPSPMGIRLISMVYTHRGIPVHTGFPSPMGIRLISI